MFPVVSLSVEIRGWKEELKLFLWPEGDLSLQERVWGWRNIQVKGKWDTNSSSK